MVFIFVSVCGQPHWLCIAGYGERGTFVTGPVLVSARRSLAEGLAISQKDLADQQLARVTEFFASVR
ncbi:hypothetical protein [Shinella zoogloeoides]|uniref:hypothetical protein n=1 Tax=Shinella zoogloeoides TaxID=352475 RepID=UPI0028ABBF1D|nr:hypothetical protein [Shinella zoogloeoides]